MEAPPLAAQSHCLVGIWFRAVVNFPTQVLGSELKAQQPLLIEAEQSLQDAKKCSSTLASQFQEHCPDIERQEAELHRLNQRFSSLNKQIEHRSAVGPL